MFCWSLTMCVAHSIQRFRQRSLLITFLCHQVSYIQLQWFRSNCHYRKANTMFEKVTLTQVLCLSKQFSPIKVPRCHSHCATLIWEVCMALTLVDVCSCCHSHLRHFLWTPCFDEDRAFPGIMTTNVSWKCVSWFAVLRERTYMP
jgi:hypothetical protein